MKVKTNKNRLLIFKEFIVSNMKYKNSSSKEGSSGCLAWRLSRELAGSRATRLRVEAASYMYWSCDAPGSQRTTELLKRIESEGRYPWLEREVARIAYESLKTFE